VAYFARCPTDFSGCLKRAVPFLENSSAPVSGGAPRVPGFPGHPGWIVVWGIIAFVVIVGLVVIKFDANILEPDIWNCNAPALVEELRDWKPRGFLGFTLFSSRKLKRFPGPKLNSNVKPARRAITLSASRSPIACSSMTAGLRRGEDRCRRGDHREFPGNSGHPVSARPTNEAGKKRRASENPGMSVRTREALEPMMKGKPL
jgi:hypothetical protein